jgi:hypothetical protein
VYIRLLKFPWQKVLFRYDFVVKSIIKSIDFFVLKPP